MKLKKTLLMLFLLLAGVVLGAMVANLCQGVPVLSWLSFSRSIGISPEAPLVLNLSVIQFTFGFAMELSVAQILAIGAAIAVYNAIRKML